LRWFASVFDAFGNGVEVPSVQHNKVALNHALLAPGSRQVFMTKTGQILIRLTQKRRIDDRDAMSRPPENHQGRSVHTQFWAKP